MNEESTANASNGDSLIVVCDACGEANVPGTLRCARCGEALRATHLSASAQMDLEATPMIGGLRIDAPVARRLHEGRLSKRSAYSLVLALGVAFIVLLQFAPTKNAIPSPVTGLRVLSVTSHSISVAWLTPKSTGDGLDHFRVSTVAAAHPTGSPTVTFSVTNSTTLAPLRPHTTYEVVVVACARSGACSRTDAVVATTTARPPPSS